MLTNFSQKFALGTCLCGGAGCSTKYLKAFKRNFVIFTAIRRASATAFLPNQKLDAWDDWGSLREPANSGRRRSS
jgi:hypothetical protein